MVVYWQPNWTKVKSKFRWILLKELRQAVETFLHELAPSTWKEILQRILSLVIHGEVEFAELYGALLALLWGIWFLLPWYDSGNNLKYPAFSNLMNVMDNSWWALLFIGMGMMQIVGLAQKSFWLRRQSSMLAIVVWLFVGLFLAVSDWHAMSCPTALACAVGAAIGYLKIGHSRVRYEKRLSSHAKPD